MQEISEKILQLKNMQNNNCSITDGQPRGNRIIKPTEEEAMLNLQMDETIKIYHSKESEALKALSNIEKSIENLPSFERRLIRLRYIDGLKWNSISKALNYCKRHVHNYHAKILKKICK